MKNNVLLVGINAKYSHSNLAIRYLQKYARVLGENYSVMEFTINQQKELIISAIYERKPDILGFSCYIWNIGVIKQIVSDIKKILPKTVIVLGGPEITDELFGADYIIDGAGEQAFFELVSALESGKETKTAKKGFDFRRTYFPYDNADIEELRGRIIYYEAQRGCPFKCAYCLSSGSGEVCRLPIERVYRELSFFLERSVRQVKFVDRTFNCDKAFRRQIWSFLIENDNGITNFHFEITAELLDDNDVEILRKARKSLFQFEIGVQTTCEKTLAAIERKSDFERMAENIRKLSALCNIRLHLDLIAGLPHESLETFKGSFNYAFALKPDILQLGFLKVLKGSKIQKIVDKVGIKHSDFAPYEVLSTNEMSYYELSELKNTEHMLESYYNSGLAPRSIEYFTRYFESPFDFFHCLGHFWKLKGYGYSQHGKMEMYEFLLDFFETVHKEGGEKSVIARETLIYDILLNDNIKTFPVCLDKPISNEQADFIAELLGDTERLAEIDCRLTRFTKKQLRKMCGVAFFEHDVSGDCGRRECAVFFHYLADRGRGTPFVIDWRKRDDNQEG